MELIRRINWVDVIALILLLRISYSAFKQGLTKDFFSALGITITVVVSLRYYAALGKLISDFIPVLPIQLTNCISFGFIVTVTSIALKFVGFFINKIIVIRLHGILESLGGLFSGVLRASITVSLIFIACMLIPVPYLQDSIRDKSLTGMLFLRVGPTIYKKTGGYLPSFGFKEAERTGDKIIQDLLEDKTLPFFERNPRRRRTIDSWD